MGAADLNFCAPAITYVRLNVPDVQRFSEGEKAVFFDEIPLGLLAHDIEDERMWPARHFAGEVVEWLMAPVLKTGRAQALVGSNPTPSARMIYEY